MNNGDGPSDFYFLFERDVEWKKVQASINDDQLELKCTIKVKMSDLLLQDVSNLDKDNMFLRINSSKSKILIGGNTSKIYELQNVLSGSLPKENIANHWTRFHYDEFRILKFFVEKKSFDYMKNSLRYDEDYFNQILENFREKGFISQSNEITPEGINKMKEAEMEKDILIAISNGQFRKDKIADFAAVPLTNIDEVLAKMVEKGLINKHNQMEERGKKMLRLYSQIF